MFKCSDLVMCVFHFLTGLPVKTKEEEEMEDFDDDVEISSYRSSRLSMSIEGNRLSIGHKFLNRSITASGMIRTSDPQDQRQGGIALREAVDESAVPGTGILNHFQYRLKQINFEMKNQESGLAIRGPFQLNQSLGGSVTQSQAFAYAQGKIQEQKTDNLVSFKSIFELAENKAESPIHCIVPTRFGISGVTASI